MTTAQSCATLWDRSQAGAVVRRCRQTGALLLKPVHTGRGRRDNDEAAAIGQHPVELHIPHTYHLLYPVK